MFEYFTTAEIEQLKGLKDSLLISPKKYFFTPLTNYTQLKEVSSSMLIMQWNYLSSGFTLLIEAIKELARAIYSLLTLHFALAWKHACTATRATLAAISKLLLDLGLLCLHSTRALTVLIATFAPELALLGTAVATAVLLAYLLAPAWGVLGFMVIIVGALIYHFLPKLNKPEPPSIWDSLHNDLDDYRRMIKEVVQERREIIKIHENICDKKLRQSLPLTNPYQLFSDNPKLLQKYERIKMESEESVASFYELMNSYPGFDSDRAKEPGYIRDAHKEMVEHHEKVKLVAEMIFKKIIDYQDKKETTTSWETRFSTLLNN